MPCQTRVSTKTVQSDSYILQKCKRPTDLALFSNQRHREWTLCRQYFVTSRQL